ncbi:MAG: AsmA family protein [Gammaproteobacteria bacterium]|nr:AsmA family protein [Gammaproteobacteria bacterium]
MKWIGITLAALVVLIAALLASVVAFVNPNDYKPQIEQYASSATGRALSLPGAIRLSVFPWIALRLGPATLGNPPGFGRQPFASVRHVSLRVKLLPLLLHRRLEIGRIEIDGLDLRLERDAAGRGNWQGIGGTSGTAAPPGAASEGLGALPQLAGITLTDGRIRYGTLLADHVDLDVGHLGPGVEVPVKLSLDLATHPGTPAFPIAASFDFTPDAALRRFRFATLTLHGKLPPKAPGAAATWDFSAPGSSLDLHAQTAEVPRFTLHLADARITGELRATGLLGTPRWAGGLHLDPLSLRQWLDQLGMKLPRTRDAKALTRLAVTTDFAYSAPAIHLSNLDWQLDETEVRGSATITNLATHAATFDLSANRIDLDRYRSPDSASAPATPSTAPATDPLKGLSLDGRLAIGDLRVAGLHLSQVRIGVSASGGVLRVAPANAALYGGSATGQVTIDDRTAVPGLRVTEKLTGVDVARLLQDFAQTRRLSGRANLSATLAARGRGTNAMLRSLSGHVAANVTGGAIEGIDLWSDVNHAISLWQHHTLSTDSGSGRTRFDALSASATLVDGIATTKDLTIASRTLRVTGEGTTNLPTRAIDYRLQVRIPSSPTASAPALAAVPVMVTGTLTAPKVSPDLEGLAKASFGRELRQRGDALKKKLEEKLKSLLGH